MENRRTYYRLILINFAAAWYNLATQWLHSAVSVESLWQQLIGVFFPAVITLLASLMMLQRKPRGVQKSLLQSSVIIQVLIWILIISYRGRAWPIPMIWFGIVLTFVYAVLAWRIMIESRESSLLGAQQINERGLHREKLESLESSLRADERASS